MRPDEPPAAAAEDRPRGHLFRRCALGLWFCALALLGLVRAWLASTAPADGAGGMVAALWFWGSLALLVIGVLALARALGRRR